MAKRKTQGESVMGYFRKVFAEHPEWLDLSSNREVMERYRTDHNLPAETDLPNNVKNAMANLKSKLRKKNREDAAANGSTPTVVIVQAKPASTPVAATTNTTIEWLEEHIDLCLTQARTLDRDGLAEVIQLLRRARNQLILRVGK